MRRRPPAPVWAASEYIADEAQPSEIERSFLRAWPAASTAAASRSTASSTPSSDAHLGHHLYDGLVDRHAKALPPNRTAT